MRFSAPADDLLRAAATLPPAGDGHARELDRILAEGAVRTVYQPIIELEQRRVVGYEALARGPAGSALERPDALFTAARRAGRLTELDWACRLAALRGAFAAGLRRPLRLFVNVEPDALDGGVPAHAADLLARARDELDIVVELTERSLAARPAGMLAVVARIRDQGFAVALDDVGADPRSLALMPFVRPEIVKLDLRLVQGRPSPAIAAVVHAVNAQAERDGALVLAEGVETEAQHATALALGARYGQGWLYGRPGPLPTHGVAAPHDAWPTAPPARAPDTDTEPPPLRSCASTSSRGTATSGSCSRCRATSRRRWRRRATRPWCSRRSRRPGTSRHAAGSSMRAWPGRPRSSARSASGWRQNRHPACVVHRSRLRGRCAESGT